MNRTTVLILAIVLLLAHVLALHHDASGAFAMPSDLAHVDFRIGRNWVHGQGTAWGSGMTAAAVAEEGGTSLLWISIAATAELFSVSPLLVAAWIGILSALGTLGVIARLSRDRLIGVTATVLLVVSGPFAASASDGTATTLFTLLLTIAFLAFERRRSLALGVALGLLVLTGSLGVVFALALLGFALFVRRSERPIKLLPAFAPPLAALALLLGIRAMYGAPLLTPNLAALLAGDQLELGLWSIEAWARGTLAPLIVVLPLLMLLANKLSGTGVRALLLALLGTAAIALTGASEGAMHTAFAPVLPLYFIAVQEAFVVGLERRPQLEWAVWTSLSLACLGSVLASKTPGNIGPLRTRPLLEWMAEENAVRHVAYGRQWSGRRAVVDELDENQRLRGLGLFFRDQVAPNSIILSPWPGAIGYLSRLQVVDLLGRASIDTARSDESTSTKSWLGAPRTDAVAALERLPEYIVPQVGNQQQPPTQSELVESWLLRFDHIGPTDERRAAFTSALAPYELVAVSTPANEADLTRPGETPSFLLRRRDLGLSPTLALEQQGGRITVRLNHPGHHQLAELVVRAETDEGATWYLNPTGTFITGAPLRARTELLLFPTGDRQIKLIDFELPAKLAEARITAQLVNPFSDPQDPLAKVGAPVIREP